jgi:alginate O-acetyltransferase complex protein AlgI
MDRTETPRARKALLITSLIVNLGLLGFFKYADLAVETFASLIRPFGINYQPVDLGILLPVGISFYTFHSLSYTIDVYRRECRVWPSFLDYALFVTFFPLLVAGPIMRAVHFLPQLEKPRRADGDQFGWGLALMLFGLFQKVVLADMLMAPVADQLFSRARESGLVDAWIGTLAFSGQIYFDFAGYTTTAIGCALCLGFVLMDNFNYPYGAVGFSDFWRRWHISLSSWLRDYLYVPLGGNRKGPVRTQINLMLTMLIGGLWHGAAWRFVVWGGLHGSYLIAERHARAAWGRVPFWNRTTTRFGLAMLTYALVCLTWVFFRAHTFGDALHVASAMLTGGVDRHVLETGYRFLVVAVTAGLVLTHWTFRDSSVEDTWRRLPVWSRPVALASLLLAICLSEGDERAFIYFQF